ncbi:hypothetical protein P22_2676 [Propionispora sp. 2/2-37]|uniref:alanine racemase n=1 Tax=Propionispora sp. 2/2-37 TaxID=1677858 RepID=UPI0006BB5F9A|nr:alanine racemase [Propionispora sp. 2/2-37]CUH96586.1 hypothetical protein P22_2676 [Propionispora sp. 2/2-37]
MRIEQLATPGFLVDMAKLERNMQEIAALCRQHGKKLVPMLKTHKSTAIAQLQGKYGAEGFLTGTIDEAERLVQAGYDHIMLAYPVAAHANISRVMAMARSAHVTLSFDGTAAAEQWSAALEDTGMTIDYLIIVDCGLHRFGVRPEEVPGLAGGLERFTRLKFKGIATHPGQVYGVRSPEDVKIVAQEEAAALEQARQLLLEQGYPVEIVATGSTPTIPFAVQNPIITMLRPGNYIFYDAIQVALGMVPAERCALTVLATIISQPAADTFIMDAGSKCLGLDKGAHSLSLVSGYGCVRNHPELTVDSLSEEVGKLRVKGSTRLQVGDKIEVIPNHACAAANMTSFLIGHREGMVEGYLAVDARGGLNKR